MPIRYLQGDATAPIGPGEKIIAHVCNDVGGWGAGFVLAISQRWPGPEREYLEWFRSGPGGGFVLGQIQLVAVEPDMHVANMLAQRDVVPGPKGPPIRYDAVAECLAKLGQAALKKGATIHMPRIGCGLAGGHWSAIEPLIETHLSARGIAVHVYDFG